MSGSSKWSQIKRQKAANDQKKGQIFSKFARAIALSVKESGDNPDFNFNLRLLIDRAKAAGMPNSNIEKAIQRGSGDDKGGSLSKAIYEAFGPGGVGFIIESASDNPNRAVMEVKRVLTKNEAQMGNSGSVTWMFKQRGLILAQSRDAEKTTLEAIDAGAVDVKGSDEGLEIHTDPKELMKVKEALGKEAKIENVQISWIPNQEIQGDDKLNTKIEKLTEALEDLDDVTEVYNNLNEGS